MACAGSRGRSVMGGKKKKIYISPNYFLNFLCCFGIIVGLAGLQNADRRLMPVTVFPVFSNTLTYSAEEVVVQSGAECFANNEGRICGIQNPLKIFFLFQHGHSPVMEMVLQCHLLGVWMYSEKPYLCLYRKLTQFINYSIFMLVLKILFVYYVSYKH